MSIRVGILGYGNLGRGVECAIRQNPDMELKAVFTRRAPETVKILTEGVPVYHVDEAEAKKDEIDVSIPMQRFQSISQQSMSPHRNPERLASSPLAGIRVCSP